MSQINVQHGTTLVVTLALSRRPLKCGPRYDLWQNTLTAETYMAYRGYCSIRKLANIYVINTKNCSLSIVLTTTDQKPQKSLKRLYYPPSHCLNVNVMLSNMTFLMIFFRFLIRRR